MEPRPALKTLYSGSVTAESGYYRVTHSTGHRPETETYIDKDCYLPSCGVRGCIVAFSLVQIAHNSFRPEWQNETAG